MEPRVPVRREKVLREIFSLSVGSCVNYKRMEFLWSPFVDRLNSNWIKRNRKYSLDTLQTELVVFFFFFFKRLILRRSETHFRPISLLYSRFSGVSKRAPYPASGANKHRRKRFDLSINKKMEMFISDLISVIKNEFVGNEWRG